MPKYKVIVPINTLRYAFFASKRPRDTPKINSLPPTEAALNEHIKRAHLQTMLWKAADQVNPPDVIISGDISDLGWNIVQGVPHPCTGVTEVASPELMEMVACGCSATSACSNKKQCSCQAAGLSCTLFCRCLAHDNCHNPLTDHAADESNGDSDSEYD